jgi:hypothetical protein
LARFPYVLGAFLEVGSFLGKNRTLNWTHLKADPAINAGVKINPVKLCAFTVAPLAGLYTGDRAGINAICNALADISDDRMSHAF